MSSATRWAPPTLKCSWSPSIPLPLKGCMCDFVTRPPRPGQQFSMFLGTRAKIQVHILDALSITRCLTFRFRTLARDLWNFPHHLRCHLMLSLYNPFGMSYKGQQNSLDSYPVQWLSFLVQVLCHLNCAHIPLKARGSASQNLAREQWGVYCQMVSLVQTQDSSSGETLLAIRLAEVSST